MAKQKQKIRPTVNNARTGKNGVFQAKHLDTEKGKAAQLNGLLYTWHRYQDMGGDFEWAEKYYYHLNFEDGLDYQNEKYRKKGNYKRIRSMDEYREAPKTCPESTLYYLGNKDYNAGADVLQAVVMEYLAWRARKYPAVVCLDWAVHVEDGAPHIHERHVWVAHDEAGNKVVNQEAALREMGVERPDPLKPVGRYNNAKMTYTEACRDKMMELARSYGIEVEDQPREPGQKGLSQARYKMEDAARKTRGWVKRFQAARDGFLEAMQGDLEGLEVQRTEARVKRLMGAVGASVEAAKPKEAVAVCDMRTSRTQTELDAATEQPGRSGADAPVRTALMQQLMAMAERDKQQSGPTAVEGPTR